MINWRWKSREKKKKSQNKNFILHNYAIAQASKGKESQVGL